MKFSVIMPLYNKAPYICKALESVFAQTYTDYELIVVDDGSSDNSLAVAKQCITDRCAVDRCTVDRHDGCRSALPVEIIEQANSGVSAARNNGVAASSGDYIAFLDADDWWEPTYLERMAQLIEDYPEAGLYACNYVYYKPGKTHVALNIPTGYINYPKSYYESGAMPVTSITAIMPRAVFEEMGGFPVGIKLGEDFLLWAKTALHYPVAFCEEPLAYYNNDVPVNLRATRNLHHPNNHMLFNLGLLGNEAIRRIDENNSKAVTSAFTPYTARMGDTQQLCCDTPSKADWKSLLDKLRVNGLLEYWLSNQYHDLAAEELKKVDWNQQPDSMKRIYKTPIWMLKVKRQVMKWGSWCKQLIIRLKFRG